jgi:hypothetical protein
MAACWRNDISLSAILLGVILVTWRHKTLKVNTTAGSTYHRTLVCCCQVACKKKLLMTFGTTYVIWPQSLRPTIGHKWEAKNNGSPQTSKKSYAQSKWFLVAVLKLRLLVTGFSPRRQSQVKSFGICGRQSGAGSGFLPSTSVSPANSHSTDCYTLIIYHPGLVQ